MNAITKIAPQSIPELVPRGEPAHRIRTDAEAIAVARDLAREFSAGASQRDRERSLPLQEIERFSQSGLWAISVPKAYGGAGVSAATLAQVIAIISSADASIGQIPQNHFYMVEALRLDGSEEQKRFYFDRVLQGDRLGNALSEIGGKHASDYKTTILADGEDYVLNGQKFYSSGALFAHWIVAVAKNAEGKRTIVFVPRGTPGLTLVDDWSSFGQRTTGSGTTIFDAIRVDRFALVDHYKSFERPTPMGAVAQLIHAAVDLGIARAALSDTIAFVREKARPWVDSGLDNAYDDPYTISAIGDLTVRLSGAEALLERAGRFVDIATIEPENGHSEQASIAVAEAKVATNDVSLLATNKLFELAGTRSTLSELNLDRHWRNARTHTLHDPVRWKYHAIGNYWLNGIVPPRHGAI